jgi:ribosome maturation protein SDO1
VIKLLQTSGNFPIGRAEMKIKLEIPQKEAKRLKEKIHKLIKSVDSEEFNATSLEIVRRIFLNV